MPAPPGAGSPEGWAPRKSDRNPFVVAAVATPVA
jgi:hypothetical protein